MPRQLALNFQHFRGSREVRRWSTLKLRVLAQRLHNGTVVIADEDVCPTLAWQHAAECLLNGVAPSRRDAKNDGRPQNTPSCRGSQITA